jgi:hypothetical protein
MRVEARKSPDEIYREIFPDCGLAVDGWTPNGFAQQMNNFYDRRKNISVWQTACLILNVNPKSFE